MKNLEKLLFELAKGRLGWEALLAQFERATFTVRQPTEGGWDKVYARAEEGLDDADVPGILAAAKFARQVTPEQYDQLMEIYRQRVAQGPETATVGSPSAG